ncbi:hypothetical protein D9M72_541120 [compost metagenome]
MSMSLTSPQHTSNATDTTPTRPKSGWSRKSAPRKIGDQVASSGATTADEVRKPRSSDRSRRDWAARVSPWFTDACTADARTGAFSLRTMALPSAWKARALMRSRTP